MFVLVIRYQNGQHYWTEHFNSKPELDEWLQKEKTRPYWQKDFLLEIIDNSPPPLSEEQLEEKKKRAQAILDNKARLIELAAQPDLTDDEMKEAVKKLLRWVIGDIRGEPNFVFGPT